MPAPEEAMPESAGGSAYALLGLAMVDGEDMIDEFEPKAGDQVGRFSLINKVGEGGFAIVWRARESQPLQRDVAVKIIRPGMDSRAVMARFDLERRAMAKMSHTNIATVLEAGATSQGRPYFAMELVDGPPVTEYAAQKSLSLHEKLELFITICHAVQHAHQRGVIHRDLKPSNILVKEDDGKPVPKVIDFGIAKALTTELSPLSTRIFTSQGMLMGTPQYMAPEHTILGSDEVDVRADVYSLGAILYELLTGQPPLGKGLSKNTSVHVLLKRICEEEPSRPSTILMRAMPRVQRLTVEAKALREELDWVVLKALVKNPEDRYPSVTALSDDLRNYLQNRPLSVGPPSVWYQVKKLTQRHRTAFMVTSAILVLLLGAGIFISSAYVQEAHARRQADEMRSQAQASEQKALREVRKSEALVGFLTDLLDRAAEHVDNGRNAEVLRLALGESVHRIDDFANQPDLQAQLYHRLADVYSAMDQPLEAVELLKKEHQILVDKHGVNNERSVMIQYEIARNESRAGQHEAAIESYGKVCQALEAIHGTRTFEWFDSRRRTGMELVALGRKEQALEVLHDLESKNNGRGQLGHESNDYLRALAELYWILGQYQKAEEVLDQSLASLSKSNKPNIKRSRAATLRIYSRMERHRGNLEAAAKRLEECIQNEIEADGPMNHQLINRWIELGRLLASAKRFDQAERANREARELARSRGHLFQQIHALQASAEAEELAGNLERALALRRECEHLAAEDANNRSAWLEQWRAITVLCTRMKNGEAAIKSALSLWKVMQLDDRQETLRDTAFAKQLYDALIGASQFAEASHSELVTLWQQRSKELANLVP